jgi:hypothetical protein
MNQNKLKTVIREFLSSDKGSSVIENKYTEMFLEKRQEYINNLLKNKQQLVKRYGKDAEKVLTGRAVKSAKKYIENMKQQDIKELVRKSLMKEESNDLLSQLESALKSHDWYYMMSDDNRVWREGNQEAKNIKDLVSKTGEEGVALFKKYKEENFKLEEETIDSKKYISEREENPEDKITMDVPLFIRMLEYAREDASTDVDLHDVAKKAIGLSSEGEVLTMDNYESIVGETESLDEDLDLGHQDNEPHMIKGELYQIGKYAMELYKMVDGFEGKGEVDFPAWWQSKITTSKNMISSAKHYLEFETKESTIDNMVTVSSDEEVIDEKKLTPAEEKKKEEIVKAMKKDFKGPKPAMYAIATDKAKDLAEIIAKKLKESSYKAPSNSVEAGSLKKGDVLGSGETVVSVSSGAKTPSGKVDVTLEKNGKTRTAVWGKYTKVGIKKS